MSIADNTQTGEISGVKGALGNAGVICIGDGSTCNLYGGNITDNQNTNASGGIIKADFGGTFNMYGGRVYDNVVYRGTIMGALITADNNKACHINILGGEITGNHATNDTTGMGGGAGIYTFNTVVVGGTARIYGNTSASSNNPDIWLRAKASNTGDASYYTGALIISSEVPLERGAKINFGTNPAIAAGDPATMSMPYISFSGTPYVLEGGAISYGAGNAVVCEITTVGGVKTARFYYVADTAADVPVGSVEEPGASA